MGSILEVEDLNVGFGGHDILKKLSFKVERDSTLAVLGPNGAGKSVLFKTLLGIIPFEGKIAWQKDAVIGYVPQKLSVTKDIPLTVLEFLQLKEKDPKKISDVLHEVGIKDKAVHLHHDIRVLKTGIGSLSGGELQRILMAYALLGNPNALLLDEPTAGVDIEGEKTFYDLFKNLKENKDLTIIFISHDMEVVNKYADNILKINHEH